MRPLTGPAVFASAALLAACATPYQPNSLMRNGGYSESKRAPGIYQVWYAGNNLPDENQSEDMAVLRAAELCLAENKPFMRTANFQNDVIIIRARRVGPPEHATDLVRSTGTYSTSTTRIVDVPVRWLYTMRSGLQVTCLTARSGDAQESAAVAARLREQYSITARSTLQAPGT